MSTSTTSTVPGSTISAPAQGMSAQTASIPILISLSFCHLLNDLIQSLIPALYPLLKQEFSLDFTQIGIITLAFQMTASLL
jgi:FSR family fosmidomycin resistance protein-like MFS transporter